MIERRSITRGFLVLACTMVLFGCSDAGPTLVQEPPANTGPGFSIRFRNTNAYTVVPGEVLAIDLVIDRDEGFEGAIELEASDAPGIVVIFRPETVIHRPDSDLLIVAEQSTQRRTHQIEFSARSEGHPVKTAVLSLTVVDSK
jgi:hypothetical protein